jgi:hypothetical protein
MTPELFSKCLPKSTGFNTGSGGVPNITWEDVLQSIAGINKPAEAVIFYVFLDNPKARHQLFAYLYQETMNDRRVQEWLLTRKDRKPREIERLVLLAIHEWKTNGHIHPGVKFTENARAAFYGVSRGIWSRKYSRVYSMISQAPSNWMGDALLMAHDRLQ